MTGKREKPPELTGEQETELKYRQMGEPAVIDRRTGNSD
jgi:hypothetical protein